MLPDGGRRRGNGMAATGLLVEIGDRLRLRREELGMTQKEAADLLEMSETFYGEIERGNRRLSIERMILVHERMDMSLTWLLAGEQPIVIPEGITRQLPRRRRSGWSGCSGILRSCTNRNAHRQVRIKSGCREAASVFCIRVPYRDLLSNFSSQYLQRYTSFFSSASTKMCGSPCSMEVMQRGFLQ